MERERERYSKTLLFKNPLSHPTKNPNQTMDMENGEGERDIYCTWEIHITLGRGRERYGHDDRAR